MKKLLLLLLTLGLCSIPSTYADSTPEKLGKKLIRGAERRHEAHKDLVPKLVVVQKGPRYYDDVIYFPRGSYRQSRTRCSVVIDEHHRPYCTSHRHHDGGWRYRDYGPVRYSGLHFIISLGGRWYCDRCSSYSCSYLASDPFYGSREVIERSHDLWDSAAGYTDEWQYHGAPPTRSGRLEKHFGEFHVLTDKGQRAVCRVHDRATKCVIVVGPVDTGQPLVYVGTRIGPDDREHSAYCAQGVNCE